MITAIDGVIKKLRHRRGLCLTDTRLSCTFANLVGDASINRRSGGPNQLSVSDPHLRKSMPCLKALNTSILLNLGRSSSGRRRVELGGGVEMDGSARASELLSPPRQGATLVE